MFGVVVNGAAVAFPRNMMEIHEMVARWRSTRRRRGRRSARDGRSRWRGVEVFADGDGLRARVPGGAELAAHEAFWFAWSQFHPDTVLWPFP